MHKVEEFLSTRLSAKMGDANLREMPESLTRLVESELSPAKKCFSFLRKAILTGYFKKGQHIIERELVEILGISRSPIREAVRQLESEKLIDHHPNKGCVVVGLSLRDIKEMYELREVLGCFLTSKLVEEADTVRIKELRQRTIDEYENRDSPFYEENRFNFHIRLLELIDHRWLQRILGQLEDYIDQFHVLSYLRQGRSDKNFQEHVALLDAILAKDIEEAHRIVKRHVEASQQAIASAQALF